MLSQHDFVTIWKKKWRRRGMTRFPCSDHSENSFLEVKLPKDLKKIKIKKIENFFHVENLCWKKYFRKNQWFSWNSLLRFRREFHENHWFFLIFFFNINFRHEKSFRFFWFLFFWDLWVILPLKTSFQSDPSTETLSSRVFVTFFPNCYKIIDILLT